MQRKPSARFRTRASVSRNLSLSSTMETLMGIGSTNFARRGQSDHGTLPRRRADGKTSANIFHSFPHVAQSISAGFLLRTGGPAAIVLDFQREPARVEQQPDVDFRRLRVFDDVVDRFLEGEK